MSKNRGVNFESDAYFDNQFRELDKAPLTLDSYKDRYVDVMDQEMAKVSEKVMMHKVSNFPVKSYKERSKVNGYYAFINQNYTEALTKDYNSDTSIWVVGETLNEYAAGGKNNMSKYQEVLDRNFKAYQTSINEAIEQGVQTFNVGTNVGIDTMVQKFLRDKPGFYQHKIVTKDGAYMQYSTKKELAPEQLYSTVEGEVNVNDRFETPLKDLKVYLTLGRSKPSENIFHHLLRSKSLLAGPSEITRLKQEIDKRGGVSKLTETDWINLIGSIKLGINKAKYNQIEDIKKTLGRVISSNPKFKTELKQSGMSLLTLGKGRSEFERNFGRALLEARAKFNGVITESTFTTIDMPSYYPDMELKNSDGSKRFANTKYDEKTKRNLISINPVVNTQELFDYMEGKEGGVTSKQKELVLEATTKQGYNMEVIKELLSTKELANAFLILHEQDHIDNNDKDVYWNYEDALVSEKGGGRDDYRNFLTPDKIAIEARANITALRKIEIEKANGEDPITCKIQ